MFRQQSRFWAITLGYGIALASISMISIHDVPFPLTRAIHSLLASASVRPCCVLVEPSILSGLAFTRASSRCRVVCDAGGCGVMIRGASDAFKTESSDLRSVWEKLRSMSPDRLHLSCFFGVFGRRIVAAVAFPFNVRLRSIISIGEIGLSYHGFSIKRLRGYFHWYLWGGSDYYLKQSWCCSLSSYLPTNVNNTAILVRQRVEVSRSWCLSRFKSIKTIGFSTKQWLLTDRLVG
jgi:hypothetical protein